MRSVLGKIDRAAQTHWNVLLIGETGTGKELLARRIHERSGRSGPFVIVDCSALTDALSESELFGHVRGAFTGAVASKPGLFELADNGTIFLDEVGELPLHLQAKLLRVIQEKQMRRVGSLIVKSCDFRVVAATNRDLASAVKAGTFRADLYQRLRVLDFQVPPLRDRAGDISLLIEAFLKTHGHGCSLTPQAHAALCGYHWPGNVRELENCLIRAIALADSTVLDLVDFPDFIRNVGPNGDLVALWDATKSEACCLELNKATNPMSALQWLERHAIEKALEEANGARALAAARLGIGRTTLYRRLKEYAQSS